MSNDPGNPPLQSSTAGGEENFNAAPSVQAQIDPGTAKLGDLVTLSIRVTHPNAYTIQPPSFQKNLGTFEVYASTRLPTQVAGPNQTDVFQAQLQNFTTGQQVLPGLELNYKDLQGKAHVVKTPELKVTLQEIPPGPKDKGDIRGIKGVIGPVALSPWWWLLLAVLMAGVAAAAWSKRQRVIHGPPPPPPVPADELALKKLQQLLATGWIEGGRLKEFYSGISDTVREYLEKGFNCPALERTTTELMRDLRKVAKLDQAQLPVIKELLEECDLVKFAKFRPEPAEALQVHKTAVQIVEQTRSAFKSEDEKNKNAD